MLQKFLLEDYSIVYFNLKVFKVSIILSVVF